MTDDTEEGFCRRDQLLALAFFVLPLILYASAAPEHVLGGDNAEFLSLSLHPGVAHPSGYPLALFYYRSLIGAVPLPVPLAAGMLTALLGATSVCLLFAGARRYGAGRVAACFAAVIFMLSPRQWIASSHAEVFALNTALCLALVFVARQPSPRWRLLLLASLFGLALANHLSAVLMTPLVAAAGIGALRDLKQRARWFGVAGVGFLLGLSPYLSLFWQSTDPNHWSWQVPNSPSTLFAHLVREDYGATELGLVDQGGTATVHLQSLFSGVGADLLWAPWAGFVWGLWKVARPWRSPGQRWLFGGLLASFILAGPVFVARFNLQPEGLSLAVVERFYLLPEALLAVLAALGLHEGIEWLRERLPRVVRLALASVALLAVSCAALLSALPSLTEHHSPAVARYLTNTLSSLPQGAVLLGTGDHRVFGFDYLRGAQNLRRDVVYVDMHLLHHAWYQQRMQERLGFPLPVAKDRSISSVSVANAIMQQGRRVFLANLFSPAVVQVLPTFPYGTTIAVRPAGEGLPGPEQLEQLNVALLESFELDYPTPTSQKSWAWQVHQSYVLPFSTLAAQYRQNGDQAGEARMQRRIAALTAKTP